MLFPSQFSLPLSFQGSGPDFRPGNVKQYNECVAFFLRFEAGRQTGSCLPFATPKSIREKLYFYLSISAVASSLTLSLIDTEDSRWLVAYGLSCLVMLHVNLVLEYVQAAW